MWQFYFIFNIFDLCIPKSLCPNICTYASVSVHAAKIERNNSSIRMFGSIFVDTTNVSIKNNYKY
jgi:hypothetical protein